MQLEDGWAIQNQTEKLCLSQTCLKTRKIHGLRHKTSLKVLPPMRLGGAKLKQLPNASNRQLSLDLGPVYGLDVPITHPGDSWSDVPGNSQLFKRSFIAETVFSSLLCHLLEKSISSSFSGEELLLLKGAWPREEYLPFSMLLENCSSHVPQSTLPSGRSVLTWKRLLQMEYGLARLPKPALWGRSIASKPQEVAKWHLMQYYLPCLDHKVFTFKISCSRQEAVYGHLYKHGSIFFLPLLWSECSRGVSSSAWPAGEGLLW